jgi:glycosyltransferase involved in cell wall biosynthesis
MDTIAVRPRDESDPASLRASPGITVVVLNDFCYVQGGGSRVAIDEAVGLAEAGADVIFIGAVGPPCEELLQAQLTIECLDQSELRDVGKRPSVALQGLWNGEAGRRTREILQMLPRERTIVHLHGYTKALTTAPIRAADRLGFPIVCTLHDFFVACPNGAFFDYRENRPCPRRAMSASCIVARCDKRRHTHKLYRVLRAWLQQRRGRFPGAVRHFISLSQHSSALLTPYLPSDAHLYPLANTVGVPRTTCVRAAENRTLLYVGRLDREKGALFLARVAHELGRTVTFVGDGPLRPEIESIPGMVVTGWLARDAVQRHLDTARCLVFPSLWYETFGLTVAEAVARGVPAIVSDITAAAERVVDDVTGWQFRSGDGADLARCLERVDDNARVGAVGAACYSAFWQGARNAPQHVDDLINIYRAILRREFPSAEN